MLLSWWWVHVIVQNTYDIVKASDAIGVHWLPLDVAVNVPFMFVAILNQVFTWFKLKYKKTYIYMYIEVVS